MSLVLHGSALSPPVRSVLLTAKALDIPVQLKEVNLFTGEQKTPEYMKMNPAHSVPTLDDDGFYIWESRAIICYLVNAYGKEKDALYPKDAKKRAAIDNMLFWDGTSFYASVGAHFYRVAFQGKPEDADLKAAFLEKVSILEEILGRHSFAAGGEVSLADISLLCSLTTPEAAGFSFSSYPNISAWQERVKSKMPFYDDVTAEGIKTLASVMQKK